MIDIYYPIWIHIIILEKNKRICKILLECKVGQYFILLNLVINFQSEKGTARRQQSGNQKSILIAYFLD
jgi:hypothetical protein